MEASGGSDWLGGGGGSEGLLGQPCFMLAVVMDTNAITHGAGMSRMYS